jgi:hypothetical protein
VYTRDQNTIMSVGKSVSTGYEACCSNTTIPCDSGCGFAECIQEGRTGDYILISDGMVTRAPPLSVVHNEHFCGKIAPSGEVGVVSQTSGPVVIRFVFSHSDLA